MTIGDRVIWILPISKVNRQVRRIVAAGASSWATKVCCPASWAAKGRVIQMLQRCGFGCFWWFWGWRGVSLWRFSDSSNTNLDAKCFQGFSKMMHNRDVVRNFRGPTAAQHVSAPGKTSVVAGAPSHDSNVERSQRSERSWSSMPRRRQFMKTVDLQAWNIWGTP